MANELVQVLGAAAPEVVDALVPTLVEALAGSPGFLTKIKIKTTIKKVQLSSVQIQGLQRVIACEDNLRDFIMREMDSTARLIKGLSNLSSDQQDKLLEIEFSNCLKRLSQINFVDTMCAS